MYRFNKTIFITEDTREVVDRDDIILLKTAQNSKYVDK